MALFFFQIPAQKYPNHTFMIPNLDSFIFLSNLQLEKFEGADFKYDNNFFSNCSTKIPKQGIFGPKFKDFYFCTKPWNKTNSRMLIWNMTIIFSTFSPKIHKFGIFGPKLKDFYFSPNFLFLFFTKFYPKNTQMKHFLS